MQEVYEIDINMFDLGKFEIPNRISGRRVESGGVLTRDVGYLKMSACTASAHGIQWPRHGCPY